MLSHPHVTIEQARRLRASSIVLCEASKTNIRECARLIAECQNACAALYRYCEPKVHVSVTTLLLALPANGDWVSGEGRFARILSELLDAGTTLVEERLIDDDEDGDLKWHVRLTNPRGVTERSLCVSHAVDNLATLGMHPSYG